MSLHKDPIYTPECDTCGTSWQAHYDWLPSSLGQITERGWEISDDGTVTCSDCAYANDHKDSGHRSTGRNA